MTEISLPNFEDVQAAHQRIKPHIHQTPIVTSELINEWACCQIFFKCENAQKSGSFKIRGATNAVSQLTSAELACGVVTHSSGNHAGALAMAARTFGSDAHIVMPSNSSAVKKAAVRSYGGQIIECEPTLESRLEVSEKVRQETGAIMIPPFDHPHIIAGQGTCALELIQQVPELDTIIAPVGGGGLMSGTCLSAAAHSIQVIAAEPAGASDAFESKQQNKFVPQTNPDTIADGLRTSLGNLTWPFVRDIVSEVICVTDQEIVEAMKFFWERTKQVVEPSSAVPLAAIIKSKANPAFAAKRVGLILSGGNVDLTKLPWNCSNCPQAVQT